MPRSGAEETWREAVGTTAPPDFAVSETPTYLGRAVAALATDPDLSRFAGRTVASWTLMHEYGFTDTDGTQPDFGRWLAEVPAFPSNGNLNIYPALARR